MGRVARTKAQEKRLKNEAREVRLTHALAAYRVELTKPKSSRMGFEPIAALNGVSPSTLERRYKDKRSIQAFNQEKQILTVAEEHVLVDFILQMARRMLPPTLQVINEKANAIIASRTDSPSSTLTTEPRTVGHNWVYRFLDRHHATLKQYVESPLDSKRGRALNPTTLTEYLDAVEEIKAKRHLKPENEHAADETGIILDRGGGVEHVVGPVGQRGQHRLRNGTRESLTMMCTICANGTVSLPPTVIFSGVRFQSKWLKYNTLKCSLALAPKGCMDSELALSWIQEFEERTQPKEEDDWRALYIDSYGTHLTLEVIDFARLHKIELIGYPPNATQFLQGLDVIIYGVFKRLYAEARRKWETDHDRVTKSAFLKLVDKPFLNAFSKENILSAFRITGIHPFDRKAIPSRWLVPSEETSYNAMFPLSYPEPVCSTIEVMRAISQPSAHSHSEPMTPTRNSGSTSILFTPRKRQAVAEAVTHLRQANAASLTHFTSQSPSSARLPTVPFIQIPPTPEKARRLLRAPLDRFAGYEDVVKENNELRAQLEGMRSMLDGARRIVEGSNAELAITQLGYSQMARKLYWKKKSKSIKNRLLSTKVGRYITSDRFREVVAEEAKARKVKEKEKTAREQRWKLRKEATVWRKAATQRKKERRKRELALYEKARSDAQRQGNRLPTKPKAPPREPTPERFRVVGTMEEGEQNIEDEAEDEAEIDTDDDDADLDLEDGL